MDRKEAVLRIKNHMEHHGIGKYPHLKLKEALDMAIAALSQPNEPMTLEQLREMDGEPVWVVPTGTHEKDEPMWCVLEGPMALIPGVDYWSWGFDGYGETWMAYRRPPEGKDDT